jgi:hypothetical protein
MFDCVACPVADVVASPVLTSGGGSPPASTLTVYPIYGQSLSLGSDPVNGASVISSADASNNQFVAGVRVHLDTQGVSNENTPVDPDSMASLTTLEEQINPNTSDPDRLNFGETFASGMALHITTDNGLFVSTGRGAYTAAKLSRDGDNVFVDLNHYQNTYAGVLHGQLLAAAAEQSYAVGPVVFKQGEADGSANTSKTDWKNEVQGIRDDLARDLGYASLTDTSDLKMIIDQQAFSRSGFAYGDIAVAAIELHRADVGVICAGPTYTETFAAVNDVHLTSQGYRNYGERLGNVVEQINATGDFDPCHITGVSRSTTTITVTVHVPTPPLTTDTTLVASIADSGFTYSGATITDVSITDDGTGDNIGIIEITIDADAGGDLGFAYNNGTDQRIGPTLGSRGNIRDSATPVRQSDGVRLYNWLCVDEWVVA